MRTADWPPASSYWRSCHARCSRPMSGREPSSASGTASTPCARPTPSGGSQRSTCLRVGRWSHACTPPRSCMASTPRRTGWFTFSIRVCECGRPLGWRCTNGSERRCDVYKVGWPPPRVGPQSTVARTLWRPRALATLDAVLHCGACTVGELEAAVREQKGRRGIVKVRELLQYADGRAESAMESEARLVFIDGGLPLPELQYEIVDRCGQLWRVDFAWPDAMVVAEYESMDWHASPEALKHDRIKTARLQECGWTTIPMVVDDVRRQPFDLVARIFTHLKRAPLAG
jgi:hypothetical protein